MVDLAGDAAGDKRPLPTPQTTDEMLSQMQGQSVDKGTTDALIVAAKAANTDMRIAAANVADAQGDLDIVRGQKRMAEKKNLDPNSESLTTANKNVQLAQEALEKKRYELLQLEREYEQSKKLAEVVAGQNLDRVLPPPLPPLIPDGEPSTSASGLVGDGEDLGEGEEVETISTEGFRGFDSRPNSEDLQRQNRQQEVVQSLEASIQEMQKKLDAARAGQSPPETNTQASAADGTKNGGKGKKGKRDKKEGGEVTEEENAGKKSKKAVKPKGKKNDTPEGSSGQTADGTQVSGSQGLPQTSTPWGQLPGNPPVGQAADVLTMPGLNINPWSQNPSMWLNGGMQAPLGGAPPTGQNQTNSAAMPRGAAGAVNPGIRAGGVPPVGQPSSWGPGPNNGQGNGNPPAPQTGWGAGAPRPVRPGWTGPRGWQPNTQGWQANGALPVGQPGPVPGNYPGATPNGGVFYHQGQPQGPSPVHMVAQPAPPRGSPFVQQGMGRVYTPLQNWQNPLPPMGYVNRLPPNAYPGMYGNDFIYQEYGPGWHVPTLEECQANYMPFDFFKYIGKSAVIPVFEGDVSMYPGWQIVFFQYVHVQNAPVMHKCYALDKAVSEAIRQRLFHGLDNSALGYRLRIQRLEAEYGGQEKQIKTLMDKLKVLSDVEKGREHLQRAAHVLQQVINTPHWDPQGMDVAALVYPYLSRNVRRAFAHYCITYQPHPIKENLVALHQFLDMQNQVFLTASIEGDTPGGRNGRGGAGNGGGSSRRQQGLPTRGTMWLSRGRERNEPEEEAEAETEEITLETGTLKLAEEAEEDEVFEAGEEPSKATDEEEEEKPAKVFTQFSKEQTAAPDRSVVYPCAYCQGDHPMFKCEHLFSLEAGLRMKWITDNKFCAVCIKRHVTERCPDKKERYCAYCHSKDHNTKMHVPKKNHEPLKPTKKVSEVKFKTRAIKSPRLSQSKKKTPPKTEETNSEDSSELSEDDVGAYGTNYMSKHHEPEDDNSLCTSVIKCRVPGTDKIINLNAHADTCATDLIMPLALAEEMGLSGPLIPYGVLAHGGRNESFTAMKSELTLLDSEGEEIATVPVYCYDNPGKGLVLEDWKKLGEIWPHLADLNIPTPVGKGEAQLIIGTKFAGLLASLQPDIVGKKLGDPIAKVTRLGVFVMGKTTPGEVEDQPGKSLLVKSSKAFMMRGRCLGPALLEQAKKVAQRTVSRREIHKTSTAKRGGNSQDFDHKAVTGENSEDTDEARGVPLLSTRESPLLETKKLTLPKPKKDLNLMERIGGAGITALDFKKKDRQEVALLEAVHKEQRKLRVLNKQMEQLWEVESSKEREFLRNSYTVPGRSFEELRAVDQFKRTFRQNPATGEQPHHIAASIEAIGGYQPEIVELVRWSKASGKSSTLNPGEGAAVAADRLMRIKQRLGHSQCCMMDLYSVPIIEYRDWLWGEYVDGGGGGVNNCRDGRYAKEKHI